MTKKAFTSEGVKRLRAPTTGRLEIGDLTLPGLELRVTENGIKSWAVLYRVMGEGGVNGTGRLRKGKLKRLTLGRYPILDLAEARQKARDVLRAATEGRDPAAELRANISARHARTIDWAISEFGKLNSIATAEQRRRQLELHVLPRWRGRPLADIRRSDVHELLDHLKSEVSVNAAMRARKHLSALFNWAVDREYVAASPLFGMGRDDLEYKPRDRILSDAEIRTVWHACEEVEYPFGPLFRLLLLTGARIMEVAAARWQWISLAADPYRPCPPPHKRAAETSSSPSLLWQWRS
jgi:hypothetical protein